MTKFTKIVGLTLVLAAAASVQAQQKGQGSGLYGELAISPIKLDLDDGAQSKAGYNLNGLRVILGQKIHPNLSVEGMLGMGLGDDTKTVVSNNGTAKATSKVNNFTGAYLRAHTLLTPELEVFGRAGFARMKLSVTEVVGGKTEKNSSTDNSFSYGLGMNYNLNKTTYVGLDVTRYNTEGKSKVQGVSLTAGYRF